MVGRRIQLTTDGLGLYPPVVDALWRDTINYAVMVKEYASPPEAEQRHYSPATCTDVDVRVEPATRPGDLHVLRRVPEPIDAGGDAPHVRWGARAAEVAPG